MLPPMIPIRQRFSGTAIPDVAQATRAALAALNLGQRVRPGMRVGIPVGSRGIRNLATMVQTIVGHIKALGAEPVVVAAMGSHGGGTPEGQLEVLASLGITEASLGVSVHGTVEAEEIGRTTDGTPVYFDRLLLGCDTVLVLNRVKPHTSFRGQLESGLVKMLVVGCGKAPGAQLFHSLGLEELGPRLMEFGQVSMRRLFVAGGIAILENQRDETANVVAVAPERFLTEEPVLQERAKRLMPRLPVDRLDLLVVDQMGKDFSGTCVDTNVIGRMGITGMPDPGPWFRRIVVLDLSEGSHGNANGVGLVDLVTRRLVDKIDFRATYLNTLTVTALERAKIPITLDSDREVIQTALRTAGTPPTPRIARIANTLELQELRVSPAVLAELQGRADIEVAGDPQPWPFDIAGNLF